MFVCMYVCLWGVRIAIWNDEHGCVDVFLTQRGCVAEFSRTFFELFTHMPAHLPPGHGKTKILTSRHRRHQEHYYLFTSDFVTFCPTRVGYSIATLIHRSFDIFVCFCWEFLIHLWKIFSSKILWISPPHDGVVFFCSKVKSSFHWRTVDVGSCEFYFIFLGMHSASHVL